MPRTKIYLKMNDQTPVEVTPLYGADVAVSSTREEGEMFKRRELSGTVVFTGTDYEGMLNASINDTFELSFYMVDDDAQETLFGKASFSKLDCEFDSNIHTCTISFSAVDEYEKILAGKDNTYNLIELAPVQESIGIKSPAALQIYVRGDSKITNYIGNASYEVNYSSDAEIAAEDLTDSDLKDKFHFGSLSGSTGAGVYVVTINEADMDAGLRNLAGTYIGNELLLTRSDSLYTMKRERVVVQGSTRYQYTFMDSTDTPVKYQGEIVRAAYGSVPVTNMYIYAPPITKRVGKLSNVVSTYLYGRIITGFPAGRLDQTILYEIPSGDICGDNLNYKSVIPVDANWLSSVGSRYVISNQVQSEPTQWGVDGDGNYFVAPTLQQSDPDGSNVIPIAYNLWIPNSYWLVTGPAMAYYLYSFATHPKLNEAIPLYSAIKVLLAKLDTDIEFENTTAYSQFLFSATNPISNQPQRLYISQVTNVKKTYHNSAAKKGDITLSDILTMLRNCYQCYWFLEWNSSTNKWKFRIEHISWFKNGGSYSGSPTTALDLTTLINPRNGKPWSFGQDSFSYENSSLPKRYEFDWADEQLLPFSGYAIDVNNPYCKGNKQSNSISNFISDIDYAILTPDNITDDCFILIDTEGQLSTQNGSLRLGNSGPLYFCQNVRASMLYLILKFWLYDLSGDNISINGSSFTALDTKRVKIQENVEFPGSIDLLNTMGLIRTNIGLGEIEKITLNLSSMVANCNLKYKTE